MVNKSLVIGVSVFVAPTVALTGLRPDYDDTALLPDDTTTLVEVGRVKVSTVAAGSTTTDIPIDQHMNTAPDAFLATRQNAQDEPTEAKPVINHWWSPNSMTGQLCRFLLAAGFLFAEMMMIFVILAGIEYSLCWWKPHIFRRTIRMPGMSQDLDGTTTTRPDNPADRMGSYLVTPNLHEHVNQHNSKCIRILQAEQEAANSGKSISRASLAPATAA